MSETHRRHVRRSRSDWQQLIDEQARSGQSQRAFCAARAGPQWPEPAGVLRGARREREELPALEAAVGGHGGAAAGSALARAWRPAGAAGGHRLGR